MSITAPPFPTSPSRPTSPPPILRPISPNANANTPTESPVPPSITNASATETETLAERFEDLSDLLDCAIIQFNRLKRDIEQVERDREAGEERERKRRKREEEWDEELDCGICLGILYVVLMLLRFC